MKEMKFFTIGLLFVGITTFLSCKKEVRIEKNLWKNGGEWNIESLTAKQISTNPVDNYNETVLNYGTYTFKKDGSGSYIFTVDGDVEAGAFAYSNTEEKLTLIINNEARVFDMDWKKNNLTISITENYTSNGESITYTEILVLKKK
jgi:hypothetical protein